MKLGLTQSKPRLMGYQIMHGKQSMAVDVALNVLIVVRVCQVLQSQSLYILLTQHE
jgi:hypothetical protein